MIRGAGRAGAGTNVRGIALMRKVLLFILCLTMLLGGIAGVIFELWSSSDLLSAEGCWHLPAPTSFGLISLRQDLVSRHGKTHSERRMG